MPSHFSCLLLFVILSASIFRYDSLSNDFVSFTLHIVPIRIWLNYPWSLCQLSRTSLTTSLTPSSALHTMSTIYWEAKLAWFGLMFMASIHSTEAFQEPIVLLFHRQSPPYVKFLIVLHWRNSDRFFEHCAIYQADLLPTYPRIVLHLVLSHTLWLGDKRARIRETSIWHPCDPLYWPCKSLDLILVPNSCVVGSRCKKKLSYLERGIVDNASTTMSTILP